MWISFYCKLNHDQESGIYKENYTNTNNLFFVTKKIVKPITYKQLEKDLGVMFKPVILEKWKGHGVANNKSSRKASRQ